MCDCIKLQGRQRGQRFRVAELRAELIALIVEGDEYHAEGVKEEMMAAESLARLTHSCDDL